MFQMKKGSIVLGVLFLLGLCMGCSQSPTPAPTATPAATSAPAATKKPSDLWNDTTVFATLDQINSDTLLATAAGQQRTYLYDEAVKAQMEMLEIEEGNDVAIHFEIDDTGNYVVASIEKMLAGR